MGIVNSTKKEGKDEGILFLRYFLLLSLISAALLPAPESLHAYPHYSEEHHDDHYLPNSSSSPFGVAYGTSTFWEVEGNRILHRLVGDDSHSFLGFHPRIQVISANLPIAVLGTDENIVLSTGILNILESDEEFAFLIAHELAHKLLGHDEAASRAPHSNHAWEEEADTVALQLLKGCDMGRSGARKLLQKLVSFGRTQGFQLGDYYPTLRKRSIFLSLREEHTPHL
jgi:hypothetical protein